MDSRSLVTRTHRPGADESATLSGGALAQRCSPKAAVPAGLEFFASDAAPGALRRDDGRPLR